MKWLVLALLVGCRKSPPDLVYTTPEASPVAVEAPEPEPEEVPDWVSPFPSRTWSALPIPAGARAVAAGDVNGDGLSDLVAGGDGAAWVLFGRADGELRPDRTLTGPLDARFGAAVLGADVDGDGLSDLLIGAPGEQRQGRDRGAVYLFLGTTLRDTAQPTLAEAWTVAVGRDDDAAGARLEPLGDLDGDGRDDVLVPGRLHGYVLLGATLPGFAELLLKDADHLLVGAPEGEPFHLRAAPLDGAVLLAAPDLFGTGEAWVFDGLAKRVLDISDAQVSLNAPGTALGEALAGADVDGDGRRDAVVLWRRDGQPVVSVLDAGSLLAPGELDLAERAFATITGPVAGVAAPGDLDGDGHEELLLAGEGAEAWLLKGSDLRGEVRAARGAVFRYPDLAGPTAVAPAGDVDGDGTADLLVRVGGQTFLHRAPYRWP